MAVSDEKDADEIRAAVGKLAHTSDYYFHWRGEKPGSRRRAAALIGELNALHLVVVGIGLDNQRQQRGRANA